MRFTKYVLKDNNKYNINVLNLCLLHRFNSVSGKGYNPWKI